MDRIELIAPCHFGLESILKKEIYDLGYEISMVEDGRVTFIGDAEAIYSYEGTHEVNSLIIGRHLTGFSAFV